MQDRLCLPPRGAQRLCLVLPLLACGYLPAAGAPPTSRGSASLPAPRKAEVSALTFPLKELYRLRGGELVLRDQDYQPVRIGDGVFILRGSKVILLDTTAAGAEKATGGWAGDLVIDPKVKAPGDPDSSKGFFDTVRLGKGPKVTMVVPDMSNPDSGRMTYPPGHRLVAGLSLDGKVLAVADQQSVTGLEVSTGKRLYRKSMERILTDPNAKDSWEMMRAATGTPYMSIGEGVLITNSVCVDLATGAARWRAEPADDLKWRWEKKPEFYQYEPVVILPDRVFIQGPAIDIQTGKRLPGEPVKPGRIAVSHEQVLAMHKGGHHAIGQCAAALGVYPPLQSENRLLAFDQDRLVIATGEFCNGVAQGPVEVVSIKTKHKLGSFLLGKDQQSAATAYAVESCWDGNSVYVLTGAHAPSWQMPANGQYGHCGGLTVHRIDLDGKSGKPAWTTVIDPEGEQDHSVLPMVLGQTHLALKADEFAYVLNLRTGELKEKISLGERCRFDVWAPVGPPVMTNGRMVVETADGVAVYGPAR